MIELNLTPQYTDEELDEMKGIYIDDSYYDTLITEDCDCYREDGSILFKFRKGISDANECEVAFLAFKNLAKPSHSRGASAGPIDPNSTYWKKRPIIKLNKPGGWTAEHYTPKGNKSTVKITNEIIEQVGLKHRSNFQIDKLSGGERQRVAIARSIIHKPKIIFADEPTGNLDKKNAKNIFSLLTDLANFNNSSLIVATHDIDMSSMLDKSLRIKNGSLEEL